jgi:cytochrome c-type biogenesis protein CcmF
VSLAVTLGLTLARKEELRGTGELGDLLSREFVFLVTNLLFLGSAAAVLLGTLWPTLTESLRGVAATLSPESYNRFMGPLGLLLVMLIGLCPVIDWRRISTGHLMRRLWIQVTVAAVTALLLVLFRIREAWAVISFSVTAFVAATIVLQMAQGIAARMRAAGENLLVATGQAITNNRRRYGGSLVHLSILLIVMGITGSQGYQAEVQVALAVGESVQVSDYTLAYQDYTYRQPEEGGNKIRNQAVVDIFRGGRQVATVRPERNLHSNVQGAVSEVALRTGLREDLYIVLAGLEPDGLAAFQVLINPLVVWLWIGGGVLMLGTLVAAWPAGERKKPS